MTFRYWLADLISGGELTYRANGWNQSYAFNIKCCRKLDDASDRLEYIASLETKSANATVRKMARIARGEE